MRGSTVFQVQQLWQTSGINQIGISKHSAKNNRREMLAVSGDSATAQNIAKGLGIHSYSTADAYRDVWISVLNYAKMEHGVRSIDKLTGEIVAGYLNTVVCSGVKYATFQQYAAATEKLATALNWYTAKNDTKGQYDFSNAISDVRKTAQVELDRFTGSRAYNAPLTVIEAISNPDYILAAVLQHTGGARISEVALIRPEQLRGLNVDEITGTVKGYFEAQGKAGKVTLHHTDAETYRLLEKRISEVGLFKVDKNKYRAAIKEACAATGNTYQGSGSHGFRWCFASERFNQCMASGMTYEESLARVSLEMSHERVSITEHYRR